MFCSVCQKDFKKLYNLKNHYKSIIHKTNLELRNSISNEHTTSSTIKQQIPLKATDNEQILDQLTNQEPHESLSDILFVEKEVMPSNANNPVPTIPSLDSILESLSETDNIKLEDQSNSVIKYECPGCEYQFTHKPNLYRHRQKCNYYKEAIKLANTTQIDVKTASRLIKRKNLAKCIPQLKLDQELDNFIPLGDTNIINNNNTTNNNTTINNNVNIMVGNWETLDFIRPFLHEYIEHLYTRENRIKIISSGNNAANTVIDVIYEMPQNKNIYRYNSRRNFVKTLDINGEIVLFPANEAFGNLAFGILNITDDIMTNSEDILTEFPQYRRGVEAYALTNNWTGESGNERYPEYSRKIEIKVETSHKISEANINRFETAKQRILSNGGLLEFNKHTLKNKPYRADAHIQQTIAALKEKFLAQHI